MGGCVRARLVAERRAEVDRAVGRTAAGWQRTSATAVHWAEPVGMESGLGTAGKANDGRTGARFCVGGRRHRFSQTGQSFGGGGPAVFGHFGQDGELSGGGQYSSGQPERKRSSGLAPVPP